MKKYDKLVGIEVTKSIYKVEACKYDDLQGLAKRTKVYGEELAKLKDRLTTLANRYVRDNDIQADKIEEINEINKIWLEKYQSCLN